MHMVRHSLNYVPYTDKKAVAADLKKIYHSDPKEIRKVIYMTNIIESLNKTLKKSVKNRGSFSTEDGLMKVLYLVIKGISNFIAPRLKKQISNSTRFNSSEAAIKLWIASLAFAMTTAFNKGS